MGKHEGYIKFFGVRGREINCKKLRKRIAFVNRKAMLFSGKVRDNIEKMDKEKIQQEKDDDEYYKENHSKKEYETYLQMKENKQKINDWQMIKALHYFGFWDAFKETMNMDDAIAKFITIVKNYDD